MVRKRSHVDIQYSDMAPFCRIPGTCVSFYPGLFSKQGVFTGFFSDVFNLTANGMYAGNISLKKKPSGKAAYTNQKNRVHFVNMAAYKRKDKKENANVKLPIIIRCTEIISGQQ